MNRKHAGRRNGWGVLGRTTNTSICMVANPYSTQARAELDSNFDECFQSTYVKSWPVKKYSGNDKNVIFNQVEQTPSLKGGKQQ